VSPERHPNHRDPASLPVELRRTGVPAHVRAWIARETGAAVVRVRRLAGASSTAVHRVDLGRRTPPLVLRRYVWPAFLDDEPLAPQREVEALVFAVRHGLPAPAVVAANACRGPWGCDVGICRRNLVDLGGPSAADRFLAAYESLTGRTYHPYWEIASILEGGGPSSWDPPSVALAEARLADALAAA
jgi:hypothetical protein